MTRAKRGLSGLAAAVVAVGALGLVVVMAQHRPTTSGATVTVPVTTAAPSSVTSASAARPDSTALATTAEAAPQTTAAAPPVSRQAAAVTPAPVAVPATRPGRSLSLTLTATSPGDGSASGQIVVTNSNDFVLNAVDLSARVDGAAACQLTADFPTSLQIGPSVTVPVPAHESVNVSFSCTVPDSALTGTFAASATWNDRRISAHHATASVTLDLAP